MTSEDPCKCAQVKYDTFVTVYMSDCDFYPRVRAAGFETLNYPQVLTPPDMACHTYSRLYAAVQMESCLPTCQAVLKIRIWVYAKQWILTDSRPPKPQA